ncbi:MAG: HD domain-containing protein, partial [Deltaproteobacteria bacterium]|nr:HD domain-containing protein [Deltaproteobacteria bacterium]
MLESSKGATPNVVDRKLIPGQSPRFQKQIEFILEVDKLKHVLRQTILMDRSRRENSAEHSWHIALLVLVLAEHSKETDIDFFHVMKMLVIHDLVEIDAGDTYCYDDKGRENQAQREEIAADRIFGLLPADLVAEFRGLWDEFEKRETAESRFANALDRVQPFLHNYFTDGQTWRENNINSRQVQERMRPVKDGAPDLWDYVNALIGSAV